MPDGYSVQLHKFCLHWPRQPTRLINICERLTFLQREHSQRAKVFSLIYFSAHYYSRVWFCFLPQGIYHHYYPAGFYLLRRGFHYLYTLINRYTRWKRKRKIPNQISLWRAGISNRAHPHANKTNHSAIFTAWSNCAPLTRHYTPCQAALLTSHSSPSSQITSPAFKGPCPLHRHSNCKGFVSPCHCVPLLFAVPRSATFRLHHHLAYSALCSRYKKHGFFTNNPLTVRGATAESFGLFPWSERWLLAASSLRLVILLALWLHGSVWSRSAYAILYL